MTIDSLKHWLSVCYHSVLLLLSAASFETAAAAMKNGRHEV